MATPSDDDAALYSGYESTFEVGDRVRLKPRPQLDHIRAKLIDSIINPALIDSLYWIPEPEFFAEGAGVVYEVAMVYFFHGGLPILMVRDADGGVHPQLRYFEGFFERCDPGATDAGRS